MGRRSAPYHMGSRPHEHRLPTIIAPSPMRTNWRRYATAEHHVIAYADVPREECIGEHHMAADLQSCAHGCLPAKASIANRGEAPPSSVPLLMVTFSRISHRHPPPTLSHRLGNRVIAAVNREANG